MPLPGSDREKQFLQEIKKSKPEPEFLQEIKEPAHEPEELVEEKPKKKRKLFGRKKKS
jgi:hypothetical protein